MLTPIGCIHQLSSKRLVLQIFLYGIMTLYGVQFFFDTELRMNRLHSQKRKAESYHFQSIRQLVATAYFLISLLKSCLR